MENKRTKIKEIHPDMERYLAEDCYYPGEIYDVTGIFFTVYKPEDECIILDQTDKMTAILSNLDSEHPQAIMVWHDEPTRPNKVISAQEVDGTENNISILKTIVRCGDLKDRRFDEFKPGSTAKSLEEILSIADAVIID